MQKSHLQITHENISARFPRSPGGCLGQEVPYPAETGASCSAWDEKNHPDCQGAKPAAWCKKAPMDLGGWMVWGWTGTFSMG